MIPGREVVITGMGVVSPIGVGCDAYWESLIQGKSGVRVRDRFEQIESAHRIAAPIVDFEAKKFVKPRKALKIMCGPIQYGCAAAAIAVDGADLGDSVPPERIGTVFGTETFFADPHEVADVFHKCTVNKDYQHEKWGEFAIREIQPLWMLKYLPNMAASHISIAMDARGPSNSICQGEASGLLAVMEAADLIRRGSADVVIAGGTGSQMTLTATLYRGTELLSKRIHDPTRASRPFDKQRDGMVVGEGAGAVVLESLDHAKQRNANILAKISSWSRGFYRFDDVNGFESELVYHLNSAVQRAAWQDQTVDLCDAHATGSLIQDVVEAKAIERALGDVPTVAYKGHFGNLGPGTSVVELIGSILAMNHNLVPPTLNCDEIDIKCPVNVVGRDPRRMPIKRLVKSSYSSTGQIGVVGVETP